MLCMAVWQSTNFTYYLIDYQHVSGNVTETHICMTKYIWVSACQSIRDNIEMCIVQSVCVRACVCVCVYRSHSIGNHPMVVAWPFKKNYFFILFLHITKTSNKTIKKNLCLHLLPWPFFQHGQHSIFSKLCFTESYVSWPIRGRPVK